jgi:hypothetical protein
MKEINPNIIDSIELGSYANDGTGDDLRTAFIRVNNNFALLDAEAAINGGVNLGSGIGIYKSKVSTNLEFKSLTSVDTSVTITPTATTIDLLAKTKLLNDPAPTLGANLTLNGRNIVGIGDVQTTVWGIDIINLNSALAMLIESSNLTIDLGSYGQPAGYDTEPNGKGYSFDMGYFMDPPSKNQFNFGTFV